MLPYLPDLSLKLSKVLPYLRDLPLRTVILTATIIATLTAGLKCPPPKSPKAQARPQTIKPIPSATWMKKKQI